MNISVNNSTQEISENTSILALLLLLNRHQNGIAVAINEEIIPKSLWKEKLLSENDAVLIVQSTQGG
jgi:sulfur carrier protein